MCRLATATPARRVLAPRWVNAIRPNHDCHGQSHLDASVKANCDWHCRAGLKLARPFAGSNSGHGQTAASVAFGCSDALMRPENQTQLSYVRSVEHQLNAALKPGHAAAPIRRLAARCVGLFQRGRGPERVKRVRYAALGVLMFVLAAPGALYAYGLSLLSERPTPPRGPVAREQAIAAWQYIEDTTTPPDLAPLDPWTVGARYLVAERPIESQGLLVIARNHVRANLTDGRVIAWHLGVTTMAIWVSRNWSEDQILAELHRLYGNR